MKKIFYAMVMALVITAMVTTTVFASYVISPRILFGQTMFGGVVKVTGNSDGSITFEYMIAGGQGWCMTETAIHVGLSLDDFPTNPGGVIPGQFDFKPDITGCITSFTITIFPDPVEPQWAYLDSVYIAIHVVGDNPTSGMYGETGWVVNCGNLEGGQFPTNNWSAYFRLPTNAWY